MRIIYYGGRNVLAANCDTSVMLQVHVRYYTIVSCCSPYYLYEFFLASCILYLWYCLNFLCSSDDSEASTRILNPYHTVTACDRVIS